MKLIKYLLIALLSLNLSAAVHTPEIEENDDCSEPQFLMNTTLVNEHVVTVDPARSLGDDPDYYAFDIKHDGIIDITINNVDSNNKLQYAIMTSGCSVPGSVTSVNQGFSSSFSVAVTAGTPAYLYIKENTTDGNRDVDYNFTATFTPASVLTYPAGEQAISLVRSDYIYGDSETIGNGVLWQTVEDPPTDRNNAYDMVYTDIDANATTYNSSSATLDLTNSGYTVLWAGLYWQAHLCDDSGGNTPTECRNDAQAGATETDRYNNAILQANQVRIKGPSGGEYIDILGEQDKFHYILQDSDDRMLYTASAEITSYVVAEGEGEYTVANLSASEGQINRWGAIGGWAMVVIYQDPTTGLTLKNVTVFDGYQVIETGDIVDVPVTGFFTPSAGAVNSAVTIFTVDGDKEGSSNTGEIFQIEDANNGDLLTTISDALNPVGNQFNSTISKLGVDSLVRNPNHADNLGVDIDTFDVGAFLTNNQSSTSFRFGNAGDLYNLDLIVFSTELYQPRVCYTESFLIDGVPYDGVSSVPIGSIITAEVNVTNEGTTDAQGVSVENIVQDEFGYMAESLGIDDIAAPFGSPEDFISQTDALADDEADYNSSTKTMRYFLGTGADGTTGNGGTIAQDEVTRVDYNVTLFRGNDQNSTTNVYYVSYVDADLGIPFIGVQMPHCTGGGSGIQISPYALTVDGIDALDDPNVAGVIQTKIVDKPFPFYIVNVALGVPAPWTSVFPFPAFLYLADDDCNIPSASDVPFAKGTIENGDTFGRAYQLSDGTNTTDDPVFTSAKRTSRVMTSYYDFGPLFAGDTAINCTENSSVNGATGKPHTGVPSCLISNNPTENANILEEFPEAISCYGPGGPCQASTQITDLAGTALDRFANEYGCLMCITESDAQWTCSSDNFSIRPDRFFIDMTTLSPADPSTLLRAGQGYDIDTYAYTFGTTDSTPGYNQGDVNLTAFANKKRPDDTLDSTLAGIAYTNTGAFIEGNATALTTTPINFSFSDVGKLTLDLNDSNWAACDADDTPFADFVVTTNVDVTFIPFDFNITAATLTNSNSGGAPFTYFSDDLNMSGQVPLTLRAQNLQDEVTQNYADTLYEKNITMTVAVTGVPGLTPVSGGLTNQDLPFTLGQTIIPANDVNVLRFNFDRQTNNPLNPTLVLGDDIDMTATDTDGVTGTETTDAAGSIAFYYGRLHAPRTRVAGNLGVASLYYEIYCFGTDAAGTDCNATLRDNVSGGLRSEDDIRWFQNTNHTSADGNVTLTTQKNGLTNITQGAITNAVTTTIPFTYSGNRGYPYKTTMQMTNSSWLFWSRFAPDPVLQNDFELEFNQAGGMIGIDNSGSNVDANASTNTNRRLQW